ncbi:ATP-dependent RNA helicase [Vairimorpha necatrix]|uniref:RNA helicase n=1 Tax=Vairimorpha necatrix TaxID=6039 RepID=A0AAX4JEE3_9MICR
MNFEDKKIDRQIVKILKDKNMCFMTPIQAKSIPLIINGHDMLGISQTGTGKTLAFLVPIIHNLLQANKTFYCLIVTPTRELAMQIDKTVKIFNSLNVRSEVLIGGEKIEDQISRLKSHPHIVIGTPGRIFKIGQNLHLNRFRVLVLDEADKFFEEDFVTETEHIFSNLRKKRQILLFTATITENLQRKSLEICKNFKEINFAIEEKVEKLEESYFFVPRKYKECFLYSFLATKKDLKIIIFVNMKSTTTLISKLMKMMNIDNEALNGDQEQQKRNEIIDGYIKNKYNVLIITDVGSRGLDVCDVDVVINFDLPQNNKDYVHRVGRTARAGKNGMSVTLVTQYDVPQFQILEKHLNRKLGLLPYDEQFKQYEDILEKHLLKVKEEIKFEKEGKKEDHPKKYKK